MYRKMFGDVPIVFVAFTFLVAIACFCVSFWQFTTTAYEGKMLVSYNDYEAFKTAAINPEFTITKLQVMNSEPVYLDFSVRTPRGASFPLGESVDWQFNFMGSFVLVLGLLASSLPFWVYKI